MAGNLRATLRLNRDLLVEAPSAGDDPFVPLVGYACRPIERPFFHPVHGPDGGPILTQNRPTDHPWQHGIFTGLHAVNGLDFWTEHRTAAAERGTIRAERLSDLFTDGSSVSWRATSGWLGPAGERHLTETQAVTVRRGDAAHYTIDLLWTLRAARDVRIGRYDYGGLAVRLIAHPERSHLNSEGDRDAATSERRAAWCDVTAPFDGSRAWTAEDTRAGTWYGVTVFDHPQNATYPTPWRVDRQGLINPSPSLAGDWSIAEGEEASFVYRLVVHAGQIDVEQTARWHEEFAEEAVLGTEY